LIFPVYEQKLLRMRLLASGGAVVPGNTLFLNQFLRPLNPGPGRVAALQSLL
jgi:hypothetical protein